MIKTIVFDLSGVMMNNEETVFLPKIIRKFDLDERSFIKEYNKLIQLSEENKFSCHEAWRRVIELYPKINIEINVIIENLINEKKWNRDMINLIKHLRRNYRIGYYTNLCKEYYKSFKIKMNPSQFFDFELASYMINARKSKEDGFKKIIELSNTNPEDILFTDDNAEYVNIARRLGIHGVVFTNYLEFKQYLHRIGILNKQDLNNLK